VAENKDKIRSLLREADERTVQAGSKPTAQDKVALQYKDVPWPNRFDALGYVEEQKDGRRVSTGQPRDYPLFYLGKCEPTLQVTRPFGYLLPANQSVVAEKLRQHGIDVEALKEPAELPVEVYHVDKITRSSNPFQNHRLVSVQTTARKETRNFDAGTIV